MKLKMEHNCETKWMSIDIDEIKDGTQLWNEMNVYRHWCETKWMSIDIDEIKDVTQLWNEMNVYRHWWN